MVDVADLAKAARDYLVAARALHETHASTDVHGHGGMSGQALTAHCAWECGATGVRYENRDGVLVRIVERPPHADVLAEYERAEMVLIELLREANPD